MSNINLCKGKHLRIEDRLIIEYGLDQNYSVKECLKLNRYPYVCNGCDKVTTCTVTKSYYKAKVAESKYKEILVSSREGINMTSTDLKKIDDIVSPLIFKGQKYFSHKFQIKTDFTLANTRF